MKKFLKIYVLLFLISLLITTSVNAFSINMNLQNTISTDTTNIVEENISEDYLYENETPIVNHAERNDSSSIVKTTANTDEDEFLTIENILSIIIIVIGILLILLAIAILIRFK